MSAFMAYSVLTAVLLGGAAFVAEHALRQFRLPLRWVWVGALVGTLTLPQLFLAAPEAAVNPTVVFGEGVTEALYVAAWPLSEGAQAVPTLETWLGVLWLVLSGLLLVRLLVSGVCLMVARRAWSPDTVAGHRVLVSEDVGPAVVGVSETKIVMPRWALGADRKLQKLMLAHEIEHVQARDPLLLCLAVLAVTVTPWNLPLWWVARRLRLALEVDCDARVLGSVRSDVLAYGNLLLEVGRRAAGLPLPAVSFAKPRSLLEHRLVAMASPSAAPGRFASAIGAVGVVATAFTLVWAAPHPIYGFCGAETVAVEVESPRSSVIIGVLPGPTRVIRTLPPAGG